MVRFFQRQINVFLVIFLITAILITLALSIFYQNMFRNMTAKYDSLAENYALTSNELDFYKNEYTNSLSNLNTSEQDIVRIGELFESSEQQIESLKGELRSTTMALDNTEEQLEDTLVELRKKKTEAATKDIQINTLNIKFNRLETDYDFLRSQATQLKILCGATCDSVDINT